MNVLVLPIWPLNHDKLKRSAQFPPIENLHSTQTEHNISDFLLRWICSSKLGKWICHNGFGSSYHHGNKVSFSHGGSFASWPGQEWWLLAALQYMWEKIKDLTCVQYMCNMHLGLVDDLISLGYFHIILQSSHHSCPCQLTKSCYKWTVGNNAVFDIYWN